MCNLNKRIHSHFQLSQLLSDLGGVVGIAIGISAISLVEILELVVNVTLVAFTGDSTDTSGSGEESDEKLEEELHDDEGVSRYDWAYEETARSTSIHTVGDIVMEDYVSDAGSIAGDAPHTVQSQAIVS